MASFQGDAASRGPDTCMVDRRGGLGASLRTTKIGKALALLLARLPGRDESGIPSVPVLR